MSASFLIHPDLSARDASIRYEESTKGSIWFISKGMLLTLLTVGIYRFWFMTVLRRNLWSRAFIDGSPAEYTGKAHELLLGFLIALAILLPSYILTFIGAAYSPYPNLGFLVAYPLFFLLVQFARYRARRYLVSRTVWRGIRLRQDGSALAYTALAAGWWLVVLLTLGVAYPFMRASLERYRMRHTLLGETRFASEAEGRDVIFNWLIVYAVTILPLLGCIGILLVADRFELPSEAFAGDTITTIVLSLYYHYSTLLPAKGVEAVILTCAGSVALIFVLGPYYRSREARAFLNAIQLNGAKLKSGLSVQDIYINCFGFIFFTIVAVVFAIILQLASMFILDRMDFDVRSRDVGIYTLFFPYAIIVFSVAWLHFRFFQIGRLAVIAETLSIIGADALDTVMVSAWKVGGRLAEGVADAVDPGGIEIGF